MAAARVADPTEGTNVDTIGMTIKRVLDNYDLPIEAAQIVDQVIRRLEEREHQIAENIWLAGRDVGLDPADVRTRMEEAGIEFRKPAVDPDERDMLSEDAWRVQQALTETLDQARASMHRLAEQVAEVKRMFGI